MAKFDLAALLPLLPHEQSLKEIYENAALPGDPFGTPEQIQSCWAGFNRLIADVLPQQAAGYLSIQNKAIEGPIQTTYTNSLRLLIPDSHGENVHVYRQDRYLPGFWHFHDFYEAVCVLSGTCHHNIAGDRYRFTAGDLALIPPNTPHTIQVLSDDAIQYNLAIRASFLESCSTLQATHHPLGELLSQIAAGTAINSYLIFKAGDYLAGDNQLAALMEESSAGKPYLGVKLEALTLSLLADLMQCCAPTTVILSMQDSSVQDSSVEEELMLYIRNHFQTITLKELTDRFHYSERQLQRMISKASGTTLTKLIGELRMDYVREQLLATDVPVAQIIDQAGFADSSHFYRNFKKQFGLSPQAYRDGGT